jgi:hypothetical protein
LTPPPHHRLRRGRVIVRSIWWAGDWSWKGICWRLRARPCVLHGPPPYQSRATAKAAVRAPARFADCCHGCCHGGRQASSALFNKQPEGH